MMKRLIPFSFLMVVMSVQLMSQSYPHVTIRDIQMIPDSVLDQANPVTDSPLLGDTAWVTGVVVTAPRTPNGPPLWFTGDRWRFIIKDPSESEFNYLTVVAVDTSFFKDSVGIDLLAVGDSVELLGRVTEFRQLTQFEPLRVRDGMNLLGTSSHVDLPAVVPVSDFFTGSTTKFNPAEKFESGFIRLENLTVVGTNGFEFTVADNQSNQFIIDDQSTLINFDGSTGVTPPPAGAKISWIQGYIFTNSSLQWTLNPRDPTDYLVGVFAPSVGLPERSVRNPGPTDAVIISSRIVDQDGTVTGVEAFYSVNDDPKGSVTFASGPDSVWSGTIPSTGLDSAFVSVYFVATDNHANVAVYPADTTLARYFYFSLNRQPTIAEVQFNPYGGGSTFLGDSLSVRGIATTDRRDYGAIYLQQPGAKWSGIRISSTADSAIRRGDDITATGVVAESFGLTILSNASITTHSTGNPVPAPADVVTSAVRTGGPDAEAYESVLIQLSNVYVVNLNEDAASNSNFGEFGISESSGLTSGLRVDDLSRNLPFTNDSSRSGQSGKRQLSLQDRFQMVRGVLDYSFSQFKLLPRDSMDFTGYAPVGTSVERIDDVPGSYFLSQNYPNPFNPTTMIEYGIGQEEHVTLDVYNILGQRVVRLVDERQPSGAYRASFEAGSRRSLTTGVYIAVLKAGSYTETRRMLLLK